MVASREDGSVSLIVGAERLSWPGPDDSFLERVRDRSASAGVRPRAGRPDGDVPPSARGRKARVVRLPVGGPDRDPEGATVRGHPGECRCHECNTLRDESEEPPEHIALPAFGRAPARRGATGEQERSWPPLIERSGREAAMRSRCGE
jgi:hypothetical protein